MVVRRATALLFAVLASNSIAASFDCTKARNFAEKEICRDGYLSGVDNILSGRYKAALNATDQQDELRRSQRDWIVIRDQCTTQKCLDQTLSARIKALDDFSSAEVEKKLEYVQQQHVAKSQAEETDRAQRKHEAYIADEQAYQQRRQAAQQQADYSQSKSQPTTSTAPTYQPSAYQTNQEPQRTGGLVTQKETFWQQIGSVAWKCALIVAILSSCWAVKLHRQEKATIYNDYTDAAITNLLPVTGLLIGLVCGWLGMPHQVYQIAVVTGVLLAVFYAIYASVKTNQGGVNIVLTIVAKLTLVSVFYIVVGLLMLSFFGKARRKGESLTQAEARQRREARLARVQIVAASAGYSFFTAWLCRRAGFTSLSECLEFDPAPRSA
ncbi:lysozyme inhibitor LprI family protein [Pseudomonas sp. GG8]